MKQIRPAKTDNLIQLENAIAAMRKARGWMVGADCPKAAEALRAAIKSAEGARRHMHHRLRRTDQ